VAHALLLIYRGHKLSHPQMAVTENLIRVLSRYSEGLRLAAQHGSTSAMLVEYACRNEPQGQGSFGRWIDRTFLQLSTWDTVRQRIGTTKELVAEVVARRRAARRPTTILDVASGTGRYLRELVRERGGPDLLVECRDRDPRQVEHGRLLVEKEGLERFTFSVGDATDEASYLTAFDPDVLLAVGLFPYLHSDGAVCEVMRLGFKYLAADGCFICSTIATPGALSPWETDPFRPRPAIRPPERLRSWLRDAGFVHIDQRFSQRDGFALIGWKPSEKTPH
jgi:SAM-dependent methyltransferase